MYTSEDVKMLVQDLHMHDDYDVMSILLSKEQAELLRDTLDVFLEGGYADE